MISHKTQGSYTMPISVKINIETLLNQLSDILKNAVIDGIIQQTNDIDISNVELEIDGDNIIVKTAYNGHYLAIRHDGTLLDPPEEDLTLTPDGINETELLRYLKNNVPDIISNNIEVIIDEDYTNLTLDD